MDTTESLASAITRFRTMANELGRFASDSEKVFLTTGASLQHLEGEASRILDESARETRMEVGASGPADSLRAGLAELDRHMGQVKSETESGLSSLTEILSGIERLSRLEGDFQLIVATLHALASTTHLENSRQCTAETGFGSVVEDVRSMAWRIKPKFAEVLAQSHGVRATAQSALTQARTFLDGQSRDVVGLRRDLRNQLETMSRACQTAQELSDKSKDSMSDVRASVASVLQSLQVHDIARQMLAHVVEDLTEFADAAESAVRADPAPPALRSWLAELAVVSNLQAAQLTNTSGRIVEGLSQIDRGLQAVVAALSTVARESARLSGKDVGTSVFVQLERGIRLSTETLHAHDRQADTMRRALSKVRDTAEGVRRLVDEVGDLGEDARFIGLNAMVKAVRVGHAGGTLTVLAREIQTVSEQIQHFTASAASIMSAIGQSAHLVHTDTDAEAGATTNSDEVATRLVNLVAELGAYQSSLSRTVDRLLSGSDALRAEVSETSRALQGLVEQAKQLRRMSYELSNLHSLAVVDARGAAPPPGRAHGDNHRYTMEQEREVERLALGAKNSHEKSDQPADAGGEAIEFF